MALSEWRISVGLMVLVELALYIHFAQAQPGFISIDCGNTANFTDPATRINWVPDANYISTGVNFQNVPLNDLTDTTLSTLRYFPDHRSKFCYTLPATFNTTYLIRAWFLYANYDRINSAPNFQVAVDATVIFTPLFTNINTPVVAESTVIAQSEQLFFCLLPNSTSDVPFINSLELRSLANSTLYDNYIYKGPYYLNNVVNYNFGSDEIVRYPHDPYDRIWAQQGTAGKLILNTTSCINLTGYNRDEVPQKILQTAQYWANSVNISFPGQLANEELNYDVHLFLAEIDPQAANETRNITMKFGMGTGDADVYDSVGLDKVYEYGWDTLILNSMDTLFLNSTANSHLGPILNGLTINQVYLPKQQTYPGDLTAIENFKSSIGLESWSGDPCNPVPYDWVNCTSNATSGIRISSIKLSNMKLTGIIPSSLGSLEGLTTLFLDNNYLNGSIPNQLNSLTNLEQLHLQNNNLSGPFPLWTTALSQLQELYLQNNNLTGQVPFSSTFANNSIQILTSGNQLLCNASGCPIATSKTKFPIAIVIAIVVVGVILVIIITIIAYRYYNVHKKPKLDHDQISMFVRPRFDPKVAIQAQAYSYDEMKIATNDFKTPIGEGGFGVVYKGTLSSGKEVAIKRSSSRSSNTLNLRAFENEVKFLSQVHHNNLVSLIGYCENQNEQILIYEYMQKGSCCDHLHGKGRNSIILDWKTRLCIAIDAAQGLEYLHKFCHPKIIHRDIKTSNILLNDKMEAKLSDFGISKPILEGESQMTNVLGTRGYLDPEYVQTYCLTEKSDIFSFGVVLLEFICGKPPLFDNSTNLVYWVNSQLEGDKIIDIIDPSFREFNLKSMRKVIDVTMMCVNFQSEHRPTMTIVLQELFEAMKLEAPQSPIGRHYAPIELNLEESNSMSGVLMPIPVAR